MTDYKFEGWLGLDADSVNGKMVWGEFEPKPWEETDVDVKITHCGICRSDLHTLRSGWVRMVHSVYLCCPLYYHSANARTLHLEPSQLPGLRWPRNRGTCRAGWLPG